MDRAANKAARILQVETLLLAYPEGLKPAEIARKLKVNRSTIGRNLDDLPKHIYVDDLDDGKWKIDWDSYLVNIRLSLHEAMAVHLATRLLAKWSNRRNHHAAAALRKLGISLKSLAPFVSDHLLASAEVMDDEAQYYDPVYLRVLETLTRAWSKKRLVKIKHQNEKTGKITPYKFAPYFIEPYPLGQTTHVIGYIYPENKRLTFKLERIRDIEPLDDEEYIIPDTFNPRELLAHAWGIWYTEDEPEKVELKFRADPQIVSRVKETRWQSGETTKDLPDGSLLWTAEIDEPREMLPWIRGWGADVEVLEPGGLRKSLEREVKRMAQQYGITTPTKDLPETRLLRCWGKTGDSVEDFHPALYHMLDVGHVAEQLLHPAAPPRWRRVLARAFNTDPQTLIHWLPWFIAMHDIGKVSVPFQAQNADQKIRLEKEGFAFGRWRPKDKQHHTITGQVFLKTEFTNLPRPLHTAWLETVGGHHGEFSESRMKREGFSNLKHAISFLKDVAQEPDEWPKLRGKTSQILQNHFLRQSPDTLPEPTNVSAAIMALTGFTILCDWLGFDKKYFSPHADTDLLNYIAISRQNAENAVKGVGLIHLSCSNAPENFERLFPARVPARPLQLAIDAIPADILRQPVLAIIEAPAGEGKTEAALALAHRLAQHTGDDEFYYALPTTATSNQMYLRIQQYLVENLGLSTGVNLVHGQAFLVKDDLAFKPMGDIEAEDAAAWFSPKKKALLAPFAVGTIDQAELAAMNVKHNALRLIGLAGKVVILDEVHAYDTYMTTIIEQMLRWLSALGSSVILLSATLPLAKREALLKAYGVPVDEEVAQSDAYPGLWIGGEAGVYTAEPRAYQLQRSFNLQILHIPHDDAEQKAEWLLDQIMAGGNACWICNTVARAQKLAQAVQQLDETVECHLLHSMFPLDSRSNLEGEIRDKYGPGGERPSRSIVIGTQVLEQSLDLDFDLMVSDLAPIDLLLQRMGRLHRHKNQRPTRHKDPALWINCELKPNDPSLLKMGADKFYTEYILQKTWQTIAQRTAITLPADYRPLVEAVYTTEPPAQDDVLFDAWQRLQKKENNAEGEAKLRLLPNPEPRRPFCHSNQQTFEEDEDSAAWIVAQTRLGAESVTVIPLERAGDEARMIPTGQQVSLTEPPARKTALDLLRHSIRISRSSLVGHFKNGGPPQETLFKESSLLKNVYPLWLKPQPEDGLFGSDDLPGPVYLHPELGLIIGEFSA